jgi:hypothetical protein
MTKKTTSKWIDLAVKPHFSWPNKHVEIEFEKRKIVLQPGSADRSCAVSVFDENGLSFEEGGKIIFRFLSRLSWSENAGIEELFIVGSNMPKRPGFLGKGSYGNSGWAQIDPWPYLYLPIPKSEKAERALAVYREAMSVNSIPYAFLGFFKVLNILYPTGKPQVEWINANLGEIKYIPEKNRLVNLQKTESNVGSYLYQQGRCAVAHAFSDDIINPDSYLNKRRLESDLCLMKAIAALCIEKEFYIMSDSSYNEYTREGFEDLPELLKKFETDDGKVIYKPFKKEMVMISVK